MREGHFELEFSIKIKNEQRWLLLKAESVKDKAGSINLAGTCQFISQQKESEKQLELAKKAAEEALEAKSQFLSNMSQEIRTPMNAILGLSDLVLKNENLPSEVRDNLQLIEYSADKLLVIINDILEFSKIEANKIKLDQEVFNLKELGSKLVRSLAPKAQSKELRLHFNYDEGLPPFVQGDPYRLNQVLLNLLSNALKFTLSGSVSLSFKLRSLGDQEIRILFSVEDTGIGIEIDKQAEIFESFTQAYNKTARHFGGTGLGLAISQSLVELMDGKLHVRSEKDKGSEFYFVIPLKVQKAEQATEKILRPFILKNQMVLKTSEFWWQRITWSSNN